MSSRKRAASCRSRRLQDLANEISQLVHVIAEHSDQART